MNISNISLAISVLAIIAVIINVLSAPSVTGEVPESFKQEIRNMVNTSINRTEELRTETEELRTETEELSEELKTLKSTIVTKPEINSKVTELEYKIRNSEINISENKSDISVLMNMINSGTTTNNTPVPPTQNTNNNNLDAKYVELQLELNSVKSMSNQITANVNTISTTTQSLAEAIQVLNTKVESTTQSKGNTELDGVPVGTIVNSCLSFAQFKLALGSKSADKWVLADGRTVPSTSDYARIANTTTVPDIRGLFMRTENGGRTDAFKNPNNSSDQALLTPIAFKSGIPKTEGTGGTSKRHTLDMDVVDIKHDEGNTSTAGEHTHTTSTNGLHNHIATWTRYSPGIKASGSVEDIGSSVESNRKSWNREVVSINSSGAHSHTALSSGAHSHTVNIPNHKFTPTGTVTLKYDNETAPNHMNVFTYIKIYN